MAQDHDGAQAARPLNTPATDAEVMAERCPQCWAFPYTPCEGRSGGALKRYHQEREAVAYGRRAGWAVDTGSTGLRESAYTCPWCGRVWNYPTVMWPHTLRHICGECGQVKPYDDQYDDDDDADETA